MALAPTPENFRAEIARHCLLNKEIAELIGMHPNMFSGFISGRLPLKGWAAHNIGLGINIVTGLRLLDVNDEIGILPAPPRGRPKNYTQPDKVDPMRRPANKRRPYRRKAS